VATAQSLITDALRLIGAVESGVTPTTDELNDGLAGLNAMLDSFCNERLLSYQVPQNTFPLVAGTATYAIGSAQTINVARPTNISSAFIRQGTYDAPPLKLLSREQYDELTDKTVGQAVPTMLFFEPSYPFGSVKLWPVPSSGLTLVFDSWQLFPVYALATTIALPPGYERMIKYNLACELAPMFTTQPSQTVMQVAGAAKASIKRMNSKHQDVRMIPADMGGRRANILTGP
jgi:hypothetical protein